jgi:hypothetical protein
MVDADSVQKFEQFNVVDVMTLYSAPRVNAHNITLDRHVQRDAFDCAARTVRRDPDDWLSRRQTGGFGSGDCRLANQDGPNREQSAVQPRVRYRLRVRSRWNAAGETEAQVVQWIRNRG